MEDGRFEWDDNKAGLNVAKHGVTFGVARDVFRDILAIDGYDERKDYGEKRLNVIGKAGWLILHVTYTERGGRIRIISARRASRYERERYGGGDAADD